MPKPSVIKVYFNRRMAALLGLGFASGLPSTSGVLGDPLAAWLGAYDVDIATITLLSLVALPFALNFLWAPLLDRFLPPGRLAQLGRRRGWLVLIQAFLTLAIAGLAFAGPTGVEPNLTGLVVMGLVVATLAASQDVLADAYRTDVLRDEELGAGAAVFVNGYRIAMVLVGGGAMMLAAKGWISWRQIYLLLAMLMALGMVVTLLAPAPPEAARPVTLRESLVEPLRDFLGQRQLAALAVLGFILLFKLPDALAARMTQPFLQVGLGFPLETIALINQWLGLGALIVGALIGGGMTARLGLMPALWLFGLLQAVSNLGFLLLAIVGQNTSMLIAVVLVEKLCTGLVTAGFIAFLMSQCNRRYSATQYALFTSLMFGSGILVSSMSGGLVKFMDEQLPFHLERLGYAEIGNMQHLGYAAFYVVSILVAVPGMAMLIWIRPRDRRGGDAPA